MAIRNMKMPGGSQDALAATLQSRRAGLPNRAHYTVSVTTLLPHYVLPRRVEPVRCNLVLVSWDGFVVSGHDIALASLRPIEGGFAFAGMVGGSFARAALKAAELGQARLSTLRTVYRPCFIESAAAGLLSLAFVAARGASRYVDLVDGVSVGSENIRLRKGLSSLLGAMNARSAADIHSEAFDFAR